MSKLWEFVDDGQNVWKFLYSDGRIVTVTTYEEFKKRASFGHVGWRKYRLDGTVAG